MKLKKGVKRTLILILIILIVGVAIFLYLKFFNVKKVKKVKVLSEISGYGYKLKDSKSEVYQQEYKNLEKILTGKNIDYEKYAESISKLFVIDFYSLEDKLAKTDVGGVEFVHSGEVEDFLEKAQDTMYKYVESNLYGNRTQALPSVASVTVNKIDTVTYTFNGQSDDKAFAVSLSWKYTNANGDGYQDKATITLIHEDKKLSIVEFK